MHEMTLAMNLVEAITRQAESENAQIICEVELEIGALAGVMAEALTFCYEAASKNTPAEGSQLNLIHIPGRGKCLNCNTEFDVESFFTTCPHCSGFGVKIIGGKDLKIRSIIVDKYVAD